MSECLWVDCRSVASHDMSMRKSSPISISASLMVVYYSGAGVVPKGKNRHRQASIPTIAMNVDSICAFAWIRRYTSLRSIFLTCMNFEGHLKRMDAIMWSILRRQKPQKHGCKVYPSNQFFTDRPDGPRKYQSWATSLLL